MQNPLEIFNTTDPDFFNAINSDRELAFKDGAISAKNKLLIALALDATKSAVMGVRSLASAALKAGATKEEIVEALRIAYFIGGVVTTFTAAEALKDLFE